MKTATLYGVSLGPGDPGLITRRGWELLHSEAIWAYPVRKKGASSYALGIVERAGSTAPDSALELVFPMTHDTEILAKYWLSAAEAVLAQLNQGLDVCFLVEGDASTYSTFSHLARTVTALQSDADIEIIAGVSAYHAAAARLQMPLADPDDAIAIIPANYGIETLNALLDQVDTLVLYKVKPVLDDIIDWLESRNLLAQARFVERVGTPEEQTIEDVATLRGRKVNYLSLMLLKNPKHQHGELIRGCRGRKKSV